MNRSAQIISLAVPLVLVGLIVTSGIALYRVRTLELPIPMATAIATLILPILTGISLRSAQTITRRTKYRISRFILAGFMLLIIYETAVATLALAHITPRGDLVCGLDRRWARLFSNKNAEAIRRIQDRYHCCGLHSVLDRSWPFPDNHHDARSCLQAFGRQRSCLRAWRRDEQITGGLILSVAVAVFVLKLLLIVLYRTENQFFSTTWETPPSQSHADDEGLTPHGNQRRINIRGQIEEPYHDSTGLEHNDQAVKPQGTFRAVDQTEHRSPVVQPLIVENEEHEWRDV